MTELPLLTENNSKAERCDFSGYARVRIDFFEPGDVVKRVQPEYPRAAVERGIEGRVVVKALVNERGLIERACAVEGEDIFRRAAETAALQWKLKPKYSLKQKGRYIEGSLFFTFRLAPEAITNETDKVTTFYVGSVKDTLVSASEKREARQDRELVNFLKTNPELQKSSFTSRFTGEFKQLPEELQSELKGALPEYRFSIARMEVYLDPPPKEYDLIVIANANSAGLPAFVWGNYWTLPPSSSFERVLEGRQARSREDALEQVKTFAKLITYASNDRVGKATARKGKLAVELVRGDGVFRVLEVQIDKHLRLGRLSIRLPNGKKPRLFV